MRAIAQRTVLAVALLGMTAIVIPTAGATVWPAQTTVRVGQGPLAQANSAGNQIHGSCFMASAEDPTIPGVNDGVIGAASVTIDNKLSPTFATVTCTVSVNNVKVAGTAASFSGNGAQAGAQPMSYFASSSDNVALCETVTYGDGTTQPEQCLSVVAFQAPPQEISDLVRSLGVILDPTVCPILATLSGNYAGQVTIDSTGDVVVGGIKVEDCPPYDVSG